MSNRRKIMSSMVLTAVVLVLIAAVFLRRTRPHFGGRLAPSSTQTGNTAHRDGVHSPRAGADGKSTEEPAVTGRRDAPTGGNRETAKKPEQPRKPRQSQPQPDNGTNSAAVTKPAALTPPEDAPEPPLSSTAQVHNLVRQAKNETGPEAIDMGNQLLNAGDPLLRAAGAAILSEMDVLDDAAVNRIAADADTAVPVNVLGWLQDTGHSLDADKLRLLLQQKGLSNDAIVRMILSGALTEAGSRIAMDMLSASDASPETEALYASLNANPALNYAVRMKAALLMRDTMDFPEYRNAVNAMAGSATDADPLWKDGISRLAKSIEGPAEILEKPQALLPSDIDEMLAIEYPMMLEDLALRIEYVMSHPDCFIQKGTADRLNSHIGKLRDLPWSPEQQVALRRIESAAAAIPALEEQDPPPHVTAPPPGAGE